MAHSEDQGVPWWHEDAGFFGESYLHAEPDRHAFVRGERIPDDPTEREVRGVVELCRLRKGDRVLDCPSGYGRHSLALAGLGFDVTGVDLNTGFLDIARTRTAPGLPVRFVRADMRELPDVEPVDAVINMLYSFGFFATREEDMDVLRGFHRVLKPGGRFLMHTMITVPAFEDGRIPKERRRPYLLGGGTLVSTRRLDRETMREDGCWTLIDDDGNERFSKRYDVRVYQAPEFAAMCHEAGFSEVRLYGDWNGEPYAPESPLLVAVATV
jgi:ubiquinone/menaquinone biosynthesis C-methylase UbiE